MPSTGSRKRCTTVSRSGPRYTRSSSIGEKLSQLGAGVGAGAAGGGAGWGAAAGAGGGADCRWAAAIGASPPASSRPRAARSTRVIRIQFPPNSMAKPTRPTKSSRKPVPSPPVSISGMLVGSR